MLPVIDKGGTHPVKSGVLGLCGVRVSMRMRYNNATITAGFA